MALLTAQESHPIARRPPSGWGVFAAALALTLQPNAGAGGEEGLFPRCVPSPAPAATPCLNTTYPCYFISPPEYTEYTVGDCVRFDVADVPGLARPLRMELRGAFDVMGGSQLTGGIYTTYATTSNSFVIVLTDIPGLYSVVGTEAIGGAFCICGPPIILRSKDGATPTPAPTPLANPDDPAPKILVKGVFSDQGESAEWTKGKVSLDRVESWVYPIRISNTGTQPLTIYRIYPRNYPAPYRIIPVGIETPTTLCPNESRFLSFKLDIDYEGAANDIKGYPEGSGLTQEIYIGIESNDPRWPGIGNSVGFMANIRVDLFVTASSASTPNRPAPPPTPAPPNICSFPSCNGLVDLNCDTVLDAADATASELNRSLLLGNSQ